MMKVSPYLHFNGNCREAFDYYRQVFGGEFLAFQTFREMPVEYKVDESMHHLIMHVTLPIGKDTMLMGSDMAEGTGQQFKAGNNFSISVAADNEKHCHSLFESLTNGGEVIMPVSQTFWGSMFGMCIDKFDISWMISYDINSGDS
ncbi:MAG: VOC family protein [Cyclobacteriaceae bacterium]